MPAAIPAIIGAGASIIGGKRQSDALSDASAAARTQLNPFDVVGAGGINAQFSDGRVRTDLGDLNPVRQGLRDFSLDQLRSLGGGNPFGAASQTSNSFGQLADRGTSLFDDQFRLNQTEGRAINAERFADQNLRDAQGPFQGGIQDAVFNNAQQLLGGLDQTGTEARDAALQNFRAQAQPQNERAVNSQLNSLFGSGRLGTTGGANVIGRLAESQNQQDLGFQQAAFGEGRAAQNQQLGLAQNQIGIGQGLRGQQDQLLNSAFSRFGQTLGTAQDLNNNRFDRGLQGAGFQAGLLGQLFGQQTQIPQLQQQFQGGGLNQILAGLQGIGGLQDQALNQFGAGLNAEQAAANARIGSGSNIAAIAQNSNFGASPLTGLGGALIENAGSVGDFLGGIFN